jgi:hypothetical protein
VNRPVTNLSRCCTTGLSNPSGLDRPRLPRRPDDELQFSPRGESASLRDTPRPWTIQRTEHDGAMTLPAATHPMHDRRVPFVPPEGARTTAPA